MADRSELDGTATLAVGTRVTLEGENVAGEVLRTALGGQLSDHSPPGHGTRILATRPLTV